MTSAAGSFVHLHNHTEYSMLDGAAKVDPLFAEAKRLGMTAVGMSDHGNMFGASDFYNTAVKYDIKPIIGIEAYIAPESRFSTKRVRWGDPSQKSDDVSGSGAYTHMTMVAENATGLRNLFKLSSLASIEGQLGKWSRMDAELIAEHAGTRDEVAAVTEAAMRGELDFAGSLHARVATLEGLSVEVLDRVRAAVRLTPGARTLVSSLVEAGHVVGLVSGGFTEIVDDLARGVTIYPQRDKA